MGIISSLGSVILLAGLAVWPVGHTPEAYPACSFTGFVNTASRSADITSECKTKYLVFESQLWVWVTEDGEEEEAQARGFVIVPVPDRELPSVVAYDFGDKIARVNDHWVDVHWSPVKDL